MKNKKLPKLKGQNTQTVLTARNFGVILEDIDSKLDLVVEGHQVLDKKISQVDKKLEDFKQDVGEQFDEVNYKFEIVFDKFEQIDKRFEQVDKRFDEVTGELRVIRHELKEKVGREEFILLEKRVAILEKSKK